MVKVNGKKEDADGMTVAGYLHSKGYDAERCAVEKNGIVVKKEAYPHETFSDGDSIEIVSFTGGG